jgi:outer membrane protein assembly factor BamD (BamD/ComL family)
MRRIPQLAALLLLSSCVRLPAAPTTQSDADKPDRKAEAQKTPPRKKPSWFHRPAQNTPQKQLEYALRLVSEGRQAAAMKQYLALVCTWHDTPEAAKAQLAYATILEQRGRYVRAFDEFQYLMDHYVGLFPYEDVLSHQFQIANHMMTRREKGSFRDKWSSPDEALPMFDKIVQNAPNWQQSPDAQFFQGVINENKKDYDLAIAAYEKVEHRYPSSPLAEDAAFRRAHCLYQMAKASPRDETSCRNALSALAAFRRDHPASSSSASVQALLDELNEHLADSYYQRALYYDRIAKRPRAALIAYSDFLKKFPSSRLAEKAAERVETLQKEIGKP